jgi:hypothetical protein
VRGMAALLSVETRHAQDSPLSFSAKQPSQEGKALFRICMSCTARRELDALQHGRVNAPWHRRDRVAVERHAQGPKDATRTLQARGPACSSAARSLRAALERARAHRLASRAMLMRELERRELRLQGTRPAPRRLRCETRDASRVEAPTSRPAELAPVQLRSQRRRGNRKERHTEALYRGECGRELPRLRYVEGGSRQRVHRQMRCSSPTFDLVDRQVFEPRDRQRLEFVRRFEINLLQVEGVDEREAPQRKQVPTTRALSTSFDELPSRRRGLSSLQKSVIGA